LGKKKFRFFGEALSKVITVEST